VNSLRALPPADARVLVVDDDRDLREALCEVLLDAGYQVSSAGNGFEALRQLADAAVLPDLLLLDVMMPIMDGYTFRQVQLADPRLATVPTIALSAGPVDARLQGMRLAAWIPKPVSVAQLVGAVERHRSRRAAEVVAVAMGPGVHSMQFYSSDRELAVDVAGLLAPSVQAGDAAIVIATAEHWQGVETELAATGCDPATARARGALRVLDARETLDSFLRYGRLDEQRFIEVVGPVVASAERLSPRIRAYGEMVDLLWQAGEVATAVSLEQCWNRLLATARCDLHCAYAAPITETHRAGIDWIRQQHAA
jgi:DNA-binding response OmpR family regulator